MPSFGASQSVSGRGGLNSGRHSKMRMKVAGVASGSGVGKWSTKSGAPHFGASSLDMSYAEKTGPNYGGIKLNSQKDKVKQRWIISGITKDSLSAPLPNCTVQLFNTNNDAFIAEVVSNSVGYYEFTLDGNVNPKYAVAYLVGSPDIAGTTVNTLTPTLT
jgi:hypothetical protein